MASSDDRKSRDAFTTSTMIDADRQRRWIQTPPAVFQPVPMKMSNVGQHANNLKPTLGSHIIGHPRGGQPRGGRVGSPEAAVAAAKRSQQAEMALHDQINAEPAKSRSRSRERRRPGSRSRSRNGRRPGSRSRSRDGKRPGSRSASRERKRSKSPSKSRPGTRGSLRSSLSSRGKSSGSMSQEQLAEQERVRRQIRLRPAFDCAEKDDIDGLLKLLEDSDIFGPFLRPQDDMLNQEFDEDGNEIPYVGKLGDPASPERIMCLNARESAIKEMSFLHIAAFHNNLRLCRLFLSFPDVDIEPRDWHGMTPLLLAANKNNLSVAQELIRRGANAELTDKFGRSMLVFSRWHTVNVLLVESRRDHLEEISNGVAWANRALTQLSNARDILTQQKEAWGLKHEEVEKWCTLVGQKHFDAQKRLTKLVNIREHANHAVEDARRVLMEEISQRDKVAAKAKSAAETCRRVIERYHQSKSKMLRAKHRHANLVRKRAEIRAQSASKVGIVDAMKRLAPLSVDAQAFCALALRVVTHNNPIESAKVVVRGGVGGLLSAMRRFPTSITVQKEGCGALANLVQLNAFAREEVSAQGGVQVVFQAMHFLKDSKETQISGMRLLCGLTGALEESGEVQAALEAHMERSNHVQPGSIEWDELQRAKDLVKGSSTSAEQDRNAAIRVAAFAEPIITNVFLTFGYDAHGIPHKDLSIEALRMAAQALYGLACHGLHSVLQGCIVPLCNCIAPCLQDFSRITKLRQNRFRKKSYDSNPSQRVHRSTFSRSSDRRPETSSSRKSVSFSENNQIESSNLSVAWKVKVVEQEENVQGQGSSIDTNHNPESFHSSEASSDSDESSDNSTASLLSDSSDDEDWISKAGIGKTFKPILCGSSEHLDFLRFAVGALVHIAQASKQMVDGVLISKAAAIPIHVAHCIRACTLWTNEVRERENMMKRDPLAFVKGGRREGEEPAHVLKLRLQQLQLNCCLLMSILTTASDEAVRKAMVREGGFEGSLFVLQSVTIAGDSEPLGVKNTPENVLIDLKAAAARACYLLLLGVRDPYSSFPFLADHRDVVPLIDVLCEFPDSRQILEWVSRCFATLAIIRKNQVLLIQNGAVEAVVHALKLQKNDSNIVLHSLRCIYPLLGSPDGCDRAASTGAVSVLMEIVKSCTSERPESKCPQRQLQDRMGEIKNLSIESLKLIHQLNFTGMEKRISSLHGKFHELNVGLSEFIEEFNKS